MGNKNSGQNFPHASREQRRKHEMRYNTPEYYRNNERMGEGRYDGGQPGRNFPENVNDNLNTQYDDLNTGKYENYNGGGYYGSNYGSINERNRGRDYEQNSGYRESYNRLTLGQWPEIERAEQNRQQHGAHKGKGPRSYQRTDFRIREDINDLLYEDPYVDASEVEVNVENGEVILTGTVEDKNMKRRIDDIIENVSGVKHFENRIRARRSGGQVVNIRNSR